MRSWKFLRAIKSVFQLKQSAHLRIYSRARAFCWLMRAEAQTALLRTAVRLCAYCVRAPRSKLFIVSVNGDYFACPEPEPTNPRAPGGVSPTNPWPGGGRDPVLISSCLLSFPSAFCPLLTPRFLPSLHPSPVLSQLTRVPSCRPAKKNQRTFSD